jgi:hypothetical protein
MAPALFDSAQRRALEKQSQWDLFLQEWEECHEEVSRAQRDLEKQREVNELKLQAASKLLQGLLGEDQAAEVLFKFKHF